MLHIAIYFKIIEQAFLVMEFSSSIAKELETCRNPHRIFRRQKFGQKQSQSGKISPQTIWLIGLRSTTNISLAVIIYSKKCVLQYSTRFSSGGIPFTNINRLTDSKIAFNLSPSPFYGARPEQLNVLQKFTKGEEHLTMSAPYYNQTAGKIFVLTGEIEYLIGEILGN